MIKDAKRLYALGLAVHWLHPASKRPIGMKWTTGPRKTWQELEDSYQYGYNVGVRLGAPSKIGKGFLAVVDCDVKSDDPAHLKEMREKLRELLGDVKAPEVHSGRGNGSRHIYGVTSEPAQSRRYAQSPVKVQVHMPSVEATRHELASLGEAACARGVRLRAAWEISIMGDRSQVVLPPSIHPDTGGAYEWAVPLERASALPSFVFKAREKDAPRQLKDDFKLESVDLISAEGLPDHIVEMILSGEGVEDRSSSLFVAAITMLKAGFTDNQILSVLTDQENFLGLASYEHAQTSSRKRAAEWVRRYTLAKAKKETDAASQFDDECETITLTDEAAASQLASIESERNWQDKIERTSAGEGFRPKPSLKNINLILKNAVGVDVFKRNLFSGTDTYGLASPWNATGIGADVQDIDVTNLIHWFVRKWGFEPPKDRVYQAISQIASENPFHPVREYLDGLEWDGVGRIDGWLKRYLKAEAPEPYLSAVSRKVLVAMIARVYEPGVKFDQVLILEGDQGVGKSTAVRVLSDPWFSDAHINISDKDAVVSMRSIWVMELGELSGMRKADVDQLKEFVSRQTDRIRLPYGRLAENMPRQCIFIGTTNSTEYLRDTTGNRRFWPVRVEGCDFKALRAVRDQLLAEARFAYELNEPLYLEEKEAQAGASSEQEARVWQDEWVHLIGDFLKREHENFDLNRFTVGDLFGDFGCLPGHTLGVGEQMRAASALRILGYAKLRARAGGERRVFWERKK